MRCRITVSLRDDTATVAFLVPTPSLSSSWSGCDRDGCRDLDVAPVSEIVPKRFRHDHMTVEASRRLTAAASAAMISSCRRTRQTSQDRDGASPRCAPRVIKERFPRWLRQRCLAHKMRNLQSKVPEEV
jgi:hypothetical protein